MATYTDYCNSGGKASRYALQLVIDLIPQTDLDKQNNLTRANLNLILAGAKYFGLPVDYVGSSFNGYTCYGTITIQNARTNTDLYVGQGSASGTVSSTSAISICSASEVPLPHNDDGTLTINFSGVFTGGLSSQASGGRVAGTLPVPTIARATTLTDQTLYVGKSDNVVALSPMDASFHHILSFNCGGRYFEARGNDRITFDLNDDSIYNLFAGASERVVGYLATYSNFNYSTQIGETKSANITIATQEHLCKPVITYQNNVDVNETTKALSDKYIDGYSDCKLTIGCETPHSEVDYILVNGKEQEFALGEDGYYHYIINGVTKANNEIQVFSKRGYSSEKKQINLEMLGYIAPTFTKGLFSRNTPTDGILKLDYSGRAFTGDFKSGANAFTINLDWVEGENNGTIPLTEATIGDGQFSQTINLSDEDKDLFNYQKNYQFTLRITDTLRSQLGLTDVIITGAITKGIPIWWWDDLSFNVEGDLKIDGKSMFDLIYPVGSIYMSIDSTNPKILFGGEWQQIKGRFLLGTGTPDANSDNYFGGLSGRTWNAGAGSTGGEDFHTLTVAEMPSHRHEGIKWFGEQNISLNSTGSYGGYGLTSWSQQIPESYSPFYTAYTGGNSAFAKMPPYFAVYIWQRVG